MSTPGDDEFIRIAVASGHLTEEQAEEIAQALRAIEALGGAASAPDLLVKRGLLDEHRVGLVRQAMAASKTVTRIPRELAGFEILERIGQGGMGTVFRARQKELNRSIALKVLLPRLARSKAFVERFFREARAAGRLSHPNIVAAIDVGEAEGFYYFAMEFVDGEPLTRLLAREGPLPEARALAIAADVARALDHAHTNGLIHRDVKPDNIMIAADGAVRVADFGLARAIDAAPREAGKAAGQFVGTPHYVSPEQIRSEPDIDCRADIFSLGVTLFEMLTSERPFQGSNPMAIAAAIASEPLPSLRKARPQLGLATCRVVEKMTAKDRDRRYATPAEAAAALDAAAAAPHIAARTHPPAMQGARKAPPPRRPARRRRRSKTPVLISVALGIAAHVALFLFLYPRLSRKPKPRPGTAPATHHAPAPTTAAPAPATSTALSGAELLDQLTRAVAQVNQLESQSPRAYGALTTRLRQILEAFPPDRQAQLPPEGLEMFRQTQSRLQRIEGDLAQAIEADLQERTRRADALLAEGKLDAALGVFGPLPPNIRTPAATARLATLRTRCQTRAAAAFDAIDARGKALLAEGKLAEARALLTPYAACSVASVADRARSALASVKAQEELLGAEARKRAAGLYRKTIVAVLGHLAAHRHEQADKALLAALVAPELKPVYGRLREVQPLVRAASQIWEYARAGARRLQRGEQIRVGGLAGKFVRFQDDQLHLDFGGASSARPIDALRDEEFTDLVRRGCGQVTPQTEAQLGLFFLAVRRYEAARAHIGAAKAKGIDVARELDLLRRFAPRPCADCKGRGTIPCPACGGKGIASSKTITCPVCKGKGGGRCGYCRGTGRMRCDNCNGRGRIGGGPPCLVCGGRGTVRCTHCGGDGHLTCKRCKGTGKLTKTTPCPKCKGEKNISCPTCAGKGTVPPADLAAQP